MPRWRRWPRVRGWLESHLLEKEHHDVTDWDDSPTDDKYVTFNQPGPPGEFLGEIPAYQEQDH